VDAGERSSYLAIRPGATVLAEDETRLGEVKSVLADADRDIFDGLVVSTSNGDRYVEAAEVGEVYERAVVLQLSAAEAAELPEPE
jgi:hypothetical protein